MDLDELLETNISELEHYGVKGMKWGVRRRVGSDGLVVGAVKKGLAKTTAKVQNTQGKVNTKKANKARKDAKSFRDGSEQLKSQFTNKEINSFVKQFEDRAIKYDSKAKMNHRIADSLIKQYVSTPVKKSKK